MLEIQNPFHGAVLNRRHGRPRDHGLEIQVSGQAPRDQRVTVNGVEAQRSGNQFACPILLKDAETDILAVADAPSGRGEHKVRVVWDKNSRPRYRFAIDDNSFFLRDIANHNYASLFDCFYLKILRGLNEKYGAKFVLNCYYLTDDDPSRPFQMPDMPDRYRAEWADNAHWLKLSFHAWSNMPSRPYQYASAEKLAGDFDRVRDEIIRFAGDETWSPPTVIHWAMVQPHALPILAQRGVKVLSGVFRPASGGHDINYLLDPAQSEHVHRHKLLKDFESGILFSRVDIICNNVPTEQTESVLECAAHQPEAAEVRDLFTHEQYFWRFYSYYLPDHAQRLDAAIRWVTERGYEPVFFHEGFLGIAG